MTQNTIQNKWFDENVEPDIGAIVVRINVKLPKRTEITRDFRPDVDIDYDNLEEQMIEMPSVFAFWSGVLSEQRAVVAMVERKILSKRAAIASKIIESAPDISRWKLDELVEADTHIQELESKFIAIKKNESKLFDAVNALRMKNDMLRSLAGFKRQEYQDAK